MNKKHRMIVLASVSFVFSMIFYALIDAPLFGVVIPETEASSYWIPVSLMMFLLTFGITLAPVFWRRSLLQAVREDFFGVILIVATPAILVSSGILDLVSASVIELVRGRGPLNWLNYPSWWWMDPYPLGPWAIPWSIAWLVSLISGHEHTLTVDMGIGSVVGLSSLLFAWVLYARR